MAYRFAMRFSSVFWLCKLMEQMFLSESVSVHFQEQHRSVYGGRRNGYRTCWFCA